MMMTMNIRLRLKHDIFSNYCNFITAMNFSLSHLMRRRIYGLTALYNLFDESAQATGYGQMATAFINTTWVHKLQHA